MTPPQQQNGNHAMQTPPIDPTALSRWTEIQNYAHAHNITINQAIEQLVNSGLSHEPRTYLK